MVKIEFKFSEHKEIKDLLAEILYRDQARAKEIVTDDLKRSLEKRAKELFTTEQERRQFITEAYIKTGDNIEYYINGLEYQGKILRCPITSHSQNLVDAVAFALLTARAYSKRSDCRPDLHAIDTGLAIMRRIAKEGTPETKIRVEEQTAAIAEEKDSYIADLLINTFEKTNFYAIGDMRKRLRRKIKPIIEEALQYLRERKTEAKYETQLTIVYDYFSQITKIKKALTLSEESIRLKYQITDMIAGIKSETTETMKDLLKTAKPAYQAERILAGENGIVIMIRQEEKPIYIPLRSEEILKAIEEYDPLTLDDLAAERKRIECIGSELRINYKKSAETISILVPLKQINKALKR